MERCYQKNPSVIPKMIHDVIFMMPVENNVVDLENIYALEGVVAIRIWELIDGQKRVRQIKGIIIEEFQGKLQEIEEDLISILKELEKRKLIKLKSNGAFITK